MERNINMAFLQTRNLQPGLATIVFLLTCGDCVKSYEKKILHQINRTAFKGETVILDCNETTSGLKDSGWRKDGNFLFNFSPVINQSAISYTSNRMQVDPRNPSKLQISDVQLSDAGLYSCFPFDIQWILTITETPKKTKNLLYIAFSVSGGVAICVFILFPVYIQRKYRKKESSEHREKIDEHQSHGGRMNHNQNSQYFERFNSVYGQVQI